jgi:hypothetical protein
MSNDIDAILNKRAAWIVANSRQPESVIMPKRIWDRICEDLMNRSWAPSNIPSEEILGMKVKLNASSNEEDVDFE